MSDDGDLLLRWRAGERSAGELLVQRHFAVVHRFFSQKVGEHAGDLIQQTFLRCQEGGDFQRRSSFRTYLFGIARYVLFEYLRSLKKGQLVDFGVSSIRALDPSPTEFVAESEQRRAVLAALQTIPLEQQLTLELHYWESLSIEEIAEVLEIPTGTVKSRLHSGRKALEKKLDRHARETAGMQLH